MPETLEVSDISHGNYDRVDAYFRRDYKRQTIAR